jgi:branched-chain amino acid transport system permease protein
MLSQLIANALIAGSIYSLVAVGFALVFRAVRFFHFTHGLVYTLGAYTAFAFWKWLNLPVSIAGLLSLIVIAIIGLVLSMSIFEPLREQRASALVSLLASIGLYVVGQNVLSLVFGDGVQSIRSDVVLPGMAILGARITTSQLTIIAFAVGVVITLTIYLSRTQLGKQIRAIASDPEVAAVVGIPVRQVTRAVIVFGSVLGGLAGILASLDRDMVPTIGMNALLMGVVAMIIGGQERVAGVALGGLLVGLCQNLGILVAPAAWQDAVVFLILVLFLLLRPQGLWGKPLRKASV